MERLFELLPRAAAAIAVLLVVVWGLAAAWGFATNGQGPLRVVAAVGVLLIVTPLIALAAAALNYWVVGLVLQPIRWAVRSGREDRL